MKKYKSILLSGLCILTIAAGVASCSDNIDIAPAGIITSDTYFTSVSDYDNALNGVYATLNSGNLSLWMDAVTDDGLVTHSWNRGYDFGRGFGNASSAFPQNKWDNDYISIQRANNIITNIDKYAWSKGENDPDRLRVLGEASVLRDYFYLDLVGIFGNILFYTANPATTEEAHQMTQSTPKEVFDFIIDDLGKIIPGLPDKPESKSKVGKAAGRLLRARAAAYAAGYLNGKSYWKVVLSETEELLKDSPKLASNYASLFTMNCKDLDEVIFVKSYSVDQKNSWGDWYNQSIGGYCVTTPCKALVDAYEYLGGKKIENRPYLNKDPRLYANIYVPGMKLRGKYYNTIPNNVEEHDGNTYFKKSGDYGDLQDAPVSVGDVENEGGGGEWNKTPTGFSWKKYFTESETWSTYNDYVVFRYAEAYLLRAEALVETGGDANEAERLVKVVRDRACNTNDIDLAVNNIYNGSLRDLIRNEERVEFADEGHRFFDIRRWGILLNVMNKPIQGIEYRDESGKIVIYEPAKREAYTQKDFYWPIPQAEMDLSTGSLKQNDGWE